jgi:RimJ/RimL family protein N-acetyltransferase
MKSVVNLRKVEADDLSLFFEQQLDPAANYMAAFTAKDPSDREAFMDHWIKITADETIIMRTILFKGQVAGHIESFEQFGQPSVGYWIGREFWGQGVATAALSQFINVVKSRPLYARVVTDNVASARVLEKCGFEKSGQDKGFAEARGREVEEFIFKLKD